MVKHKCLSSDFRSGRLGASKPLYHALERMSPGEFLGQVNEFLEKGGQRYQQMSGFYKSCALEYGLSGIGADVAAGLDPWPSMGLIEGGLSRMYMVDPIIQPTKKPFEVWPGLYALQGESTRLPFDDESLDVLLFHQCVGDIHGDPRLLHDVMDLEPDNLSEEEASTRARALGENVIHSSIQEASRVLKPKGTLLVEMRYGEMESCGVCDWLTDGGFEGVCSRTSRLGKVDALCMGRKPG